ncbi:MAG: hypothetical protein QOG86_1837 [Thermoleophilaceae bacterium]|nr:hypothetical protein [Thermoleophilaceae bacterium]
MQHSGTQITHGSAPAGVTARAWYWTWRFS